MNVTVTQSQACAQLTLEIQYWSNFKINTVNQWMFLWNFLSTSQAVPVFLHLKHTSSNWLVAKEEKSEVNQRFNPQYHQCLHQTWLQSILERSMSGLYSDVNRLWPQSSTTQPLKTADFSPCLPSHRFNSRQRHTFVKCERCLAAASHQTWHCCTFAALNSLQHCIQGNIILPNVYKLWNAWGVSLCDLKR